MKVGEAFSFGGLVAATAGPLPEPILLCPYLSIDAKIVWALIWLYIDKHAPQVGPDGETSDGAGAAYPPREWLQRHSQLSAGRLEIALEDLIHAGFLVFQDDLYVLAMNRWIEAYRDHLAQPQAYPSPLEDYECQK